MSVAQWEQIRSLFVRIRDESPEERVHLLDEACRGNQALRSEVESLLRYYDRTEDFLEEPVVVCAEDAITRTEPSAQAGRRIGKYTIIREIAAGGMGVVYEAQQEHPDRSVALKTTSSRLISSSARQRFQHESEILARLSHPGIAQVYEAGTEGDGDAAIPYFAMEFVPGGESLAEYAAKHQLHRNQRLLLFAEVCDAIHHGHQKGVIHRDLKPANILVTREGRAKVIDFGVARFVDPHAALADAATSPGQIVGTLQYMSPEQLGGDTNALDVRTDVYALGVVLFELLTGQLPYDVTKSGVYEAARTIREQPPRRPSSCDRGLRGDLEVIILKCLEKEPGRRYQSVAELAGDIRRHLRREPIEARRDSTAYVLRRNLYRYRHPLAVAVVVIAAIIAATWAVSSRRQAEDARMRAALSLGRTWTRDHAPVAASEALWREFLNRDCNRTRFALWEFYLTYPRVWADETYGRQLDVEYAPSGNWVVSVADDGRVIVYDINGGQGDVARRLGHVNAKVLTFAAQDPSRLYVGDDVGYVHICSFDDESGEVSSAEARLPDEPLETNLEGPVLCLAASPCGRWLACAQGVTRELVEGQKRPRDTHLRVWNLTTRRIVWERVLHDCIARTMAFPADGTHLAVGFEPFSTARPVSTVRIWNVESGQLRAASPAESLPRRAVAFSNNGKHLYTGGDYLFECDLPASGAPWSETQREYLKKWGIRSLAVGNNRAGGCVGYGSGDGLIRFYDTAKRSVLPILAYHECHADLVKLSFSPDGNHVASVGKDGFSLWRFLPANQIALSGEEAMVLDISERGSTLVTRRRLSGMDSEVLVAPHYEVSLWVDRTVQRSWVVGRNHAVLSSNGRRLALIEESVDELVDKQNELTLTDRDDDPNENDFGSWSVRVFEAPHWGEAATLPAQLRRRRVGVDYVTSARWLDSEGRTLLLGFRDGRVAVWYTDQNAQRPAAGIETIHEFDTEVTHFAVGAAGDWLIASSEGGETNPYGRVCLWRALQPATDGVGLDGVFEKIGEFNAQQYVWRVALVHDDANRPLVATAGGQRDINLWDARSGRLDGRLVGHSDTVRSADVIDERFLVTSSDDGTRSPLGRPVTRGAVRRFSRRFRRTTCCRPRDQDSGV